jgi:hypothetical protein
MPACQVGRREKPPPSFTNPKSVCRFDERGVLKFTAFPVQTGFRVDEQHRRRLRFALTRRANSDFSASLEMTTHCLPCARSRKQNAVGPVAGSTRASREFAHCRSEDDVNGPSVNASSLGRARSAPHAPGERLQRAAGHTYESGLVSSVATAYRLFLLSVPHTPRPAAATLRQVHGRFSPIGRGIEAQAACLVICGTPQ